MGTEFIPPDDLDSDTGPHSDSADLSLFERAFGEIEDRSQKSEYQTILSVLEKLAKKHGFNLEVYNGRELGWDASFNHRVDDFKGKVGISREMAEAIQSNTFTYEMHDELIRLTTKPEILFIKTNEELEDMLRVTMDLLEALLFLGGSDSEEDRPAVKTQKETMINDIASHSRMISAIAAYIDFIEEYITKRPGEDYQFTVLSLEALKDKYATGLKFAYPEDSEIHQQVNALVAEEIAKKQEDKTITNREFRQILRAYRDCFKQTYQDGIPIIEAEALSRCIRYIQDA